MDIKKFVLGHKPKIKHVYKNLLYAIGWPPPNPTENEHPILCVYVVIILHS